MELDFQFMRASNTDRDKGIIVEVYDKKKKHFFFLQNLSLNVIILGKRV